MNKRRIVMEEKTANPVLPEPPIPSQVRMSMVPPIPTPVEKEGAEPIPIEPIPLPSIEEETVVPEEEILLKEQESDEGTEVGTIFIKIYSDKPYDVEFTGRILGSHIDMAWRFMMKRYKVWKHELLKREEKGGV